MARAVWVGLGLVTIEGLLLMLPIAGGAMPEWLYASAWVPPMAASFLTAWLAPRRKISVGTLMFIPATLIALGSNSVAQVLGQHVDFGGLRGARILVFLTMGWSLPACLFSAIAGAALSRRLGHRSDEEPK